MRPEISFKAFRWCSWNGVKEGEGDDDIYENANWMEFRELINFYIYAHLSKEVNIVEVPYVFNAFVLIVTLFKVFFFFWILFILIRVPIWLNM